MATFDFYKQVIPDDFYQVTLEHTVAGTPDPLMVTFGVHDDVGDLELGDLEDVVQAYADYILPACHTSVVLDRATASDAGGVVYETFSGETGQDINEPSPVSTAIIIEKRSALSGRRNRGRMYIPAVNDSLVDIAGNLLPVPLAAYQTEIDTFLTTVNTVLGGGEGGMYLLHSKGWNGTREDEPADPGNAPAPTKVTSLVVKSKIGTQRRRIR